jgi:uncharacterized protein
MGKVIVADTGPLIALALVELLPVLQKLFSDVYVPVGVLEEATKECSKPGAKAIKLAVEKGWVTAHSVEMGVSFQELIEVLDQGEAEALALAKQLNAVVLIDERRGRKVAIKHGIAVTGSAAVLIKAKKSGVVKKLKPLIEQLGEHGYRMSDVLIAEVLNRVNETSG